MFSSKDEQSTLQKSLHQVNDMFYQPFSAEALAKLPGTSKSASKKKADRAPAQSGSFVRDYNSINQPNVRVQVPKKVPTAVKVETKVWFANERTFISWQDLGVLLAAVASGLSLGGRDAAANRFSLVYGVLAIVLLVYGLAIYQKRITMISTRDSGSFGILVVPVLVCIALFVAILVNFIVRVTEARRHLGHNPMSIQHAWRAAGDKSTWIGK